MCCSKGNGHTSAYHIELLSNRQKVRHWTTGRLWNSRTISSLLLSFESERQKSILNTTIISKRLLSAMSGHMIRNWSEVSDLGEVASPRKISWSQIRGIRRATVEEVRSMASIHIGKGKRHKLRQMDQYQMTLIHSKHSGLNICGPRSLYMPIYGMFAFLTNITAMY